MATLKYTGNRPHFTVITIQFIVKYLFGRRAPGPLWKGRGSGWAARRGGTGGGWHRGCPRGLVVPTGNAGVRRQGESCCQMARQPHFPPNPALLEGRGPVKTQHLAQTQPRTPTGARSPESPRSAPNRRHEALPAPALRRGRGRPTWPQGETRRTVGRAGL